MRRLIAVLLILVVFYVPLRAATWTRVSGNSVETGGVAASTLSVNLTGVSAGNTIVACAGEASQTADIDTIDLNSGAETLVLHTGISDSVDMLAMGYKLTTALSGTVTVRVTFESAVTYGALAAVAFSKTGTASDDGFYNADASVSAAMQTNSINTSGTDVLALACGVTSVTISGESINSGSADGNEQPAGYFSLWWSALTAPGVVSATATLNTGTFWVAAIGALKTTAPPPTAISHRYRWK